MFHVKQYRLIATFRGRFLQNLSWIQLNGDLQSKVLKERTFSHEQCST